MTAQSPRRVALVCPYSWSHPGGVQTHVRGLARALRARGVEAEILAPAETRVDEPGFTAAGRPLPIHDNGSVQRVALSPAAVRTTAAFVRARGFDLVHVHEPMIPAVCLTALLASPVPVVGTFHMCAPSPRWYTVFRPLCRAALERLDVRIAVSRAARDHVARACPGRYEIVPNGVEVADVEPADPPHERRIVFVGRPEPRKGLPVLLDALRRLPLARLDLIGPDDRDLTTTEPLRDRITAHGRVSDDEKARLVRSAAVLCAPSLRSESFGLVIAEAFAAGVPVVASDVAGYRELVRPDCGRLVPPGDPDALADALRAVLSDRQARVAASAAARKRAEALAWPGFGVYAAYLAVRQAVYHDRGRDRAGRNAQRIVELERRLRIHVEPTVQRICLDRRRLVVCLNAGYMTLNVLLTVGSLMRLYRRRHPDFHRLRRAAALATLGAQPSFLFFPTAPPRTLDGFTDTIRELGGIDLDDGLVSRLYDPIAAMPSIHCAYAVITSAALAAGTGNRAVRVATVAYPPAVAGAVVATANHYVLDAVAGWTLAALSLRAAGRLGKG